MYNKAKGGFIVTEYGKQGFAFMASLASSIEQELCAASWKLLTCEGPGLQEVQERVARSVEAARALRFMSRGSIDEAEAVEEALIPA